MDSITISTYAKVAHMNSIINGFIREASIIKSQISSSLIRGLPPIAGDFTSVTGIGKNIDLFA